MLVCGIAGLISNLEEDCQRHHPAVGIITREGCHDYTQTQYFPTGFEDSMPSSLVIDVSLARSATFCMSSSIRTVLLVLAMLFSSSRVMPLSALTKRSVDLEAK